MLQIEEGNKCNNFEKYKKHVSPIPQCLGVFGDREFNYRCFVALWNLFRKTKVSDCLKDMGGYSLKSDVCMDM